MHPRKEIRAAAVDLLEGQTDAGTRVYDSRDIPITENSLTPCVLIYTPSETVDDAARHQRGQRRRTMQLQVEVYDTTEDGAEVVENIGWQVETVLHQDATLGGKAESVELKTSAFDLQGNAQVSLFVLVMVFDVTYWTFDQTGTMPPPTEPVPEETPTEALVGYDPETGPGNESKYDKLT